jgi:hypothetical protein
VGEFALELAPEPLVLLDKGRAGVLGVAVGEHDQRHRPQRAAAQRLAGLAFTGPDVDPLRIPQPRLWGHRLLAQRLPHLGRQQRLEHGQAPLVVGGMHGIDQDQSGHLAGVGAGIQLGEQSAVGVAGQHVGPWDAGHSEQGVQVGYEVAGGPGGWRGVASALRAARAVIAAHPGEGRDLVLELVPVGREPALEHHGGAAVSDTA